MSALTIRGLTKSFGAQPVLAGVDLHVPAGSLTAVLGPSGCGKTTLLRLVAGFTDPDAGEVSLDGVAVADGRPSSTPARRRRVGYVPQEGALFPHLDVAANIGFGLPRSQRREPGWSRAARAGRARRRAAGPLPARALRRPAAAGGAGPGAGAAAVAGAAGRAVRLAGRRAARGDRSRGRRALRAAGATAVLVTHDQAEALSLADQVAVMRDGRLVQTGPPGEVYTAPRDPAVAQFVGAAVVLPATVEGETARCALGTVPVAAGSAQGQVRLLLRPEQLLLDEPGAGGARALVVDVSYYGHDAAIRLDLQPSGQRVLARTVGSRAPEPGSEVSVRVREPAPVFPA